MVLKRDMKKLLFVSVGCLFLCSSGKADIYSLAPSKPITVPDKTNVINLFDGFYIGVGVGGTFSTDSVTNTEHNFDSPNFSAVNYDRGSDSVRRMSFLGDIAALRVTKITQIKTNSSFDVIGGGAEGAINEKIIGTLQKKIIGDVTVGWGISFHDLYAGIELNCDLTGDGIQSGTDGSQFKFDEAIGAGNVQLKRNGKGVTFAARMGLYNEWLDVLIYGRGGICNLGIEFSWEEDPSEQKTRNIKLFKMVPVLGIGIEKKIKSFSLRLEGDYRMSYSQMSDIKCRDQKVKLGPRGGTIVDAIFSHTVKAFIETKGWVVRLMVTMPI